MTHFKKQIVFSLLALSFLLLAACQGQETPSPSPSPPTAETSSSPPPTAETSSSPPPTAETSSFPPPAAETPSASELPVATGGAQALAQSVYQTIVGDHTSRDFYIEISDDASTTRIHITSNNDLAVNYVGNYLSSYVWDYAEPDECYTPVALTLSSADGNVWLRCWEGCDQVTLHSDGQDYFLTAAPDGDRLTLFQFLLGIPDSALLVQAWADIVVDGSITDYAAVVEEHARQYAANLNALPDWAPSKPEDVEYRSSSVSQAYFGEGTENFCGHFGLYFQLEDGESSVWQSGPGMAQETEGEYAGWWKRYVGADFVRNAHGDWICTERHTGCEGLTYPTPLEEATMEELIYYFYHTVGINHDDIIPSCICRQPASELERLGAILEGYPAEEARELCLSLGKYLAEYSDRVDVGLNDILSPLTGPYRGWLAEGFSPVTRSTAYDTRVTADEVVLHNGVRPGMTYEEVCALLGRQAHTPVGTDVFSVDQDNIHYGFYDSDNDGTFILKHINIAEEAAQASIFRDIKIGDSIESVFAKIPARDTELKEWAHQTLYGTDAYDEAGYAWLEFVAMSYYSMRILTPENHISLTFSRDQLCVKWIEINVRS